ncbi:DNA binding protein [Arthrobacter phage Tuck]|uniref:DNA binding protein n=1 Tax=Arthrobacter phage Tuck TaxID=2998996 RepID=A0A9E8S3I4_9CAUD|nr:DNA binding protein [Arthrobacter phage Tuck]
MSFDKVLTDIFDRNAKQVALSQADEQKAISDALAGDSEAIVRLMYAYAPALRNAVSAFTYAGGANAASQPADHEDLRSSVTVGFMEALKRFDPAQHNRLAAVINGPLREALANDLTSPVAFHVPYRTLSRFYEILRKADGNPFEGVKIARDHHMSPEVFLSVLSAVRNVASYDDNGTEDDGDLLSHLDDAMPLWDNTVAEDDALLVEAAFEAVDDVEESVCRLAYGFETYGDPVPDIEIGHRLGMTRPTVQRRRASALGKMREALAVA